MISALLDGESGIRSTTAILYRKKASSVISPPCHHQGDFDPTLHYKPGPPQVTAERATQVPS